MNHFTPVAWVQKLAVQGGNYRVMLLMEEILHQLRLVVYPIIYIIGKMVIPLGGTLAV